MSLAIHNQGVRDASEWRERERLSAPYSRLFPLKHFLVTYGVNVSMELRNRLAVHLLDEDSLLGA